VDSLSFPILRIFSLTNFPFPCRPSLADLSGGIGSYLPLFHVSFFFCHVFTMRGRLGTHLTVSSFAETSSNGGVSPVKADRRFSTFPVCPRSRNDSVSCKKSMFPPLPMISQFGAQCFYITKFSLFPVKKGLIIFAQSIVPSGPYHDADPFSL